MTAFCVGCDNIVGGETNIIDKVAKVLEKAGHSCERLSVGPNFVQSKGLSASSKGKVAVFIVGGSDIGTYVDFRDGLKNGYYHYKFIWFAFCSWTATSWITGEDLKNKPLVRAHDDNFSSQSSIAPYLGKSADYFFSQNKDIMNYVYGQSPEELAQKILGDGGSSSDSESDSGSNSGSVKECIQNLLKHWDGDVECVIRGKNMYINQVRDPEEYYSCALMEGVNVFNDNVTVTDINPNTPNHLVVEWTGGTIEYRDELLIVRFGEHLKTMQAVKKIVKKVKVQKNTDESGDGSTSSEGTGNGTGDGTGGTDGGTEGNNNTRDIGGETYYVYDD